MHSIRKTTPYNKEEKRFGDNLPTNDKPIGDKQNSAQVFNKYNNISHLTAINLSSQIFHLCSNHKETNSNY